MQPRQRSKCSVISGETCGVLLVADPHQHDPAARGVHLLLEHGVARARRQAEAAVHAVRDQVQLGRLVLVPGDGHLRSLPRRRPGLKIRAGSKRSLTRAITASVPSGGAGHASATRVGAVEHHARARVAARRGPPRRRRRPAAPATRGRARRARPTAAALLAGGARSRPAGRSGGPETLITIPSAERCRPRAALQMSSSSSGRRARSSSPSSRMRSTASSAWCGGRGAAEAHEHAAARRRPRRRRGSRPRADARPARRPPSCQALRVVARARPRSRTGPAAGAAAPTTEAISPSVP